jgi:hypothetical protein
VTTSQSATVTVTVAWQHAAAAGPRLSQWLLPGLGLRQQDSFTDSESELECHFLLQLVLQTATGSHGQPWVL